MKMCSPAVLLLCLFCCLLQLGWQTAVAESHSTDFIIRSHLTHTTVSCSTGVRKEKLVEKQSFGTPGCESDRGFFFNVHYSTMNFFS